MMIFRKIFLIVRSVVIWVVAISLFAVIMVFGTDFVMEKIVHINREVIVPDVVAQNMDDARSLLKEQKLVLEVEREIFDRNMTEGSIISQYPIEGAKVRQGKAIKVITSKGGQRIEIPDVIGMPQRMAEIMLKNHGAIVGEENLVYSLYQEEGKVVRQNPEALTLCARDSMVHLEISQGLPTEGIKLMPNVLGLSEEDAEKVMDEIKVDYELDFVIVDEEEKKGIIVEQTPGQDMRIKRKTEIKIIAGA